MIVADNNEFIPKQSQLNLKNDLDSYDSFRWEVQL